MKSACFFSSYYTQSEMPYYVKCYLQEITRHFTETILLTPGKVSKTDEFFLNANKITVMLVDNEGYDFGMWSKAFAKYSVHEYDRIGLINDSCILFKKLDEVFNIINKHDWDYCGILDSAQVAYHLQSYFIIINKAAITHVKDYFAEHGLIEDFSKTILKYEVGISQSLLKKNLKLGAVYSYKINSTPYNPAFASIKELIQAGFPMIKKKIIFGNYRKKEPRHLGAIKFNFSSRIYIDLIKKYNSDLLIDFNTLKNDYHRFVIGIRQFRLNIISVIYNGLKSTYITVRKLIPLWKRR